MYSICNKLERSEKSISKQIYKYFCQFTKFNCVYNRISKYFIRISKFNHGLIINIWLFWCLSTTTEITISKTKQEYICQSQWNCFHGIVQQSSQAKTKHVFIYQNPLRKQFMRL